jgi:UDP-N-acetylmuramyl pentapeptide synthase
MKKILTNLFLWYLRTLARIQLAKVSPIIVGVGGASGKSSLSEISSGILSQKYKVKQSKGKNSETGIPLNILDVQVDSYGFGSWTKAAIQALIKILTNFEKYDIYVVEMGIDSPNPPKNMEYLLQFIKPRVGVLTNILLEHSEYFDDLAKSQKETDRKTEILSETANQEKLLITTIDESGRAIINLDDELIKSMLPIKAKTLTVSAKDKDADFYISKVENSHDRFQVSFTFLKENYELEISNPLPDYYAYTFIFAIAIAFSNEINIKDSISHIENNFILPPGRFSVFKGIKNSTIFDSSYNSSLEAAVGALQVVKETAGDRRKVGIMGDMRELGSLSRIQHELLAKEIIKDLDFAILIGPLMNEFIVPVLYKAKFNFKAFGTFKDAREEIVELINRGDLILVKGSQNTLFLERAVELLLEDKNDQEKLCRRGKYWDKARRKSN